MKHLPKIIIIDCFDSFTYNLVHYLQPHATVFVQRVNEVTLNHIMNYDAIVLSPGPGKPSNYPILNQIITTTNLPLLGICLGLQAIVEAFGGTLINLPQVWHGISRKTFLDTNESLFYGLPSCIFTGRYHSWVAHTIPDCLITTATDIDGYVMAISHKFKPIKAVQFHPESVLTEYGERILHNWVSLLRRTSLIFFIFYFTNI
ncbi:MAG: aminodeoxychorismate/anthranilate synthase component II [Bacteroidales bacterium]|nr:aminodeoxychorismate/anthranilate synthase component II [Bacteroidales bacterium]